MLKVLWDRGPSTVREVLDVFRERRHRRAYTSVMSLMNVMTEKKLLTRKARGRAFVYSPRLKRSKTLNTLVGDVLSRAFEGSTSSLVAHLLHETGPSSEELEAIRRTIDAYERENEGGS